MAAPRPLLLLFALVLLAALLLPAARASACSCAGPPPGEERDFYREALHNADGAIVGKLLRKRSAGGDDSSRRAIYVYRVTRAFKAKRRLGNRRVRVRSSASGASCGIEQPVGTRGGLFLHRDRGRWTSGLCSQVSPADLRRAAKRPGSGERRPTAAQPPCRPARGAA